MHYSAILRWIVEFRIQAPHAIAKLLCTRHLLSFTKLSPCETQYFAVQRTPTRINSSLYTGTPGESQQLKDFSPISHLMHWGSQAAHHTPPPTGQVAGTRWLEGCSKHSGSKTKRGREFFWRWRAARTRLKELTRASKPTPCELSHVQWKHHRVSRISNSAPPRSERMSALKSTVLVPLSSLSFTQWAASFRCDNALSPSFLSAPVLNCHTSLSQRETHWWTFEHSRRDASMESTPSLEMTWFWEEGVWKWEPQCGALYISFYFAFHLERHWFISHQFFLCLITFLKAAVDWHVLCFITSDSLLVSSFIFSSQNNFYQLLTIILVFDQS